MNIIDIVDKIIFIVMLINVLYLTFFSVASLLGGGLRPHKSKNRRRAAIFIPAYKEDAVIEECVESALAQSYPQDMYDVVVIADRMMPQTIERLALLPITIVQVNFEVSTKSKALNFAMAQVGDNYDIAVVLDADNIVPHDFMEQINGAFAIDGVRIVQAHRCAKNTNTPLAMLDAVSEEINNNIFRVGHASVGLSAALIGSGMAFEYALFRDTMQSINAVGGFDRALELTLLYRRERIYYLPDCDVLDEKVQKGSDFSRQRRRWLSAQWHYMCETLKHVPGAIVAGKWDFLDKFFQQMSLPRIMLLGLCSIIAVVTTFIDVTISIKWWWLLFVLSIALALATPIYLLSTNLLMAVIRLPYYFAMMFFNLFKLRGANKKFIHTSHGVK